MLAYYDTEVVEDIIIEAISLDFYMLLNYIWAFAKNKHEGSQDEFVTYFELFHSIKYVKTADDKNIEFYVTQVVNWLVETDDNILIALLEHDFDQIALDHIGHYTIHINTDLLLYCLKNGNEEFLKGALKLSAFDKLIFK